MSRQEMGRIDQATIERIWVKRHAGHPKNERAVQLVSDAALAPE